MMKGFKPISKLGEGAFGVVYRVLRLEDNKEYALKQIKMAKLCQKERNNALNEIRILASINHPNVVGYRDAFYNEETATLNIVMDFAAKGDLSRLIETHRKNKQYIEETEIWKVLVQACRGLKCLHSQNIVHRDLKGANIFINEEGDYLIGDLNISKVLKSGLAQTQIGTPYYASPEIWQDVPYDEKSDMWSLGCVLYEMAALEPPFKAKDMSALSRKVRSGIYSRIPEVYSKDLAIVIGSLLKVSCQLRPSSTELLDHKLVKKHYRIAESDYFNNQATMLATLTFNEQDLNKINSDFPKPNYPTQPRVLSFRQRIYTIQNEKASQNVQKVEISKGISKQKYIEESPERYYLEQTPCIGKDRIRESRQGNVVIKLPPRPIVSNRVERRDKSLVGNIETSRPEEVHENLYKEYLASRERRVSNESTSQQRRYIVPRRSLSKNY